MIQRSDHGFDGRALKNIWGNLLCWANGLRNRPSKLFFFAIKTQGMWPEHDCELEFFSKLVKKHHHIYAVSFNVSHIPKRFVRQR